MKEIREIYLDSMRWGLNWIEIDPKSINELVRK